MEILGYVAALFMGLSLGLIGGGGSILTLPILVYFFKFDGVTAATTSLFIVGSTAAIGTILNALKKNVEFKTGLAFAFPSFVGVYVTRKLILPLIPDILNFPFNVQLSKSTFTLLFFAVLMIFASMAMLKPKTASAAEPVENNKKLSLLTKGFFVGCVTGFVGAGGGFLIIPALVLLLNLPMNKAVGTSLAIITANSLLAFAFSGETQNLNWSLMLKLLGISIAGLLIGQIVAPKFSEQKLKLIFSYLVLLIAIILLLDQF